MSNEVKGVRSWKIAGDRKKIRNSTDKVPYFTRMLVIGVVLLFVGSAALDIFSKPTIYKTMVNSGGVLFIVGLLGRIFCLIDANDK